MVETIASITAAALIPVAFAAMTLAAIVKANEETGLVRRPVPVKVRRENRRPLR